MTGSNQPPRAGTQQQLERDNATYLYKDRPPVMEGTPDAVAEASPDLPDLNDALHAAMKDADPIAHSEGRLEDATLSSLRVFAAGGLIASLGRDNLQPQTRSEPTYDPTDTGIYGHDDERQKVMDIANESMKLDSNGVPLSDGKISTIYSDIRAEHLAEEKKRKDEEDMRMAHLAAVAADELIDEMFDFWDDDENWYEPEMTWDDYSAGVDQLNVDNTAFNMNIDRSQQAIQDFMVANDAQQADLSHAVADLHANQPIIQQRINEAPPGTADAAAAHAADAAVGQAVGESGTLETQRAALTQSREQAEANSRLNEHLRNYTNSVVTSTTTFRDSIRTMSDRQVRDELNRSLNLQKQDIQAMSGDEAKRAIVARVNSQLEEARAAGDQDRIALLEGRLRNANEMSGDDAKRSMLGEIDDRIRQTRDMTPEQRRGALQAMGEEQLRHAQEIQRVSDALTQRIEQSANLNRELGQMHTDYSTKLAELSADGGLSDEDKLILKGLEDQIDAKTDQVTQMNLGIRQDIIRLRGTLESESANFNVGRHDSARLLQGTLQQMDNAEAQAFAASLMHQAARRQVSTTNQVAADAALANGPASGRASPRPDRPDAAAFVAGAGGGGRGHVRGIDGETQSKIQSFSQELFKIPSAERTESKIRELATNAGLSSEIADMAVNKLQDDQWLINYNRYRQYRPEQTDERLASGGVPSADNATDSMTAQVQQNPLDYDWSSFDSELAACTAGNQQSCVALFGDTSYSQTQVPVSPIQPIGFTGSPLVSSDNGITGGTVVGSFADSEDFTRYNPKPQETGGVVPSYSKPWYTSAWDATTGFVSSLWAKLDTPSSSTGTPVDPLGQASPTMLAANNPNTNRVIPGASGAGGAAA